MNQVNKTTSIGEILNRWPKTAVLFNHHGMSCPGCYMNEFERLETALIIYQVPAETFLREINEMIQRGEKRKP
ncbi:MAG: disulfide oxidoreductase [Anaerolineaceae bacterium]|nr:disulfide oxidoreductase [Anaerolineaceae bacterium]